MRPPGKNVAKSTPGGIRDTVRSTETGIKKQGRDKNSAAKTNKPTPGMMTRGNQVFMCVWGKRRQP